jgi:parallel beta-helix repeat protein
VVVLAALLVLVGDPARAQATTRYVATTGTDFGFCNSPNSPCRTVQYAVDAASDEDLIKIATGVYTDVQGRPVPTAYPDPPTSGMITQVVYISKTVIIRGGYATPAFTDPPDPESNPTTLDAQGQGRVLFVWGNISPTIEALGITGGNSLAQTNFPSFDCGGGVYVISATIAFNANQVFGNMAGNGGGLCLWRSHATLRKNTVQGNSLQNPVHGRGGGLLLTDCDATINGNTITANTANVSSGGGLYLSSSTATLSGNTITTNTAGHDGGGLSLEWSEATLSGNTFSGNTAGWDGGGLDLIDSDATLIGNTISGNISPSGGGLHSEDSDATLNSNTVVSNTAHHGGGGLLLSRTNATLSNNAVGKNTALNASGGGLYLAESNATLINSVIADNQAGDRGSGLYIWASSPRLLHTTFARNGGGEGSGVYVYGPGTAALTNTILVSHTMGIMVGVLGTATLESTLWRGNTTNWDGAGTISRSNDYTGDPKFGDPDSGDYHLGPGSEALDRGVDAGVNHDIDPQPRPYLAPDLGADEYWPPGVLKHVYLPLVLRNGP